MGVMINVGRQLFDIIISDKKLSEFRGIAVGITALVGAVLMGFINLMLNVGSKRRGAYVRIGRRTGSMEALEQVNKWDLQKAQLMEGVEILNVPSDLKYPYKDCDQFLEDIMDNAGILFEKYVFKFVNEKELNICCDVRIENKVIGFEFYLYDIGFHETEGTYALRIRIYLPPWREEGLKLTEPIEIYNVKYNRQIDPEIIKREEELHKKLLGTFMPQEEYNEYLSILKKISDFEHPTAELREIRELERNYDISNKERITRSLRKYSEFLDKYLSDVLMGENKAWIGKVKWRDEREIY
ncbi:hypothetical protein [Thermoflavifilum thermophilum]|uniref:Uncharacterized protein n=1 Tax=Thermoflavifilum thermophilum TaxID=1393122 RepID=A0A1I7NGD6_9BACT|nr:hypothetical protein [Thermoflavifilum thermophilum]SFV33725.1 hypothetical protein SAMN05660895_1792 [Thermoflavifilum thermophilum]